MEFFFGLLLKKSLKIKKYYFLEKKSQKQQTRGLCTPHARTKEIGVDDGQHRNKHRCLVYNIKNLIEEQRISRTQKNFLISTRLFIVPLFSSFHLLLFSINTTEHHLSFLVFPTSSLPSFHYEKKVCHVYHRSVRPSHSFSVYLSFSFFFALDYSLIQF